MTKEKVLKYFSVCKFLKGVYHPLAGTVGSVGTYAYRHFAQPSKSQLEEKYCPCSTQPWASVGLGHMHDPSHSNISPLAQEVLVSNDGDSRLVKVGMEAETEKENMMIPTLIALFATVTAN